MSVSIADTTPGVGNGTFLNMSFADLSLNEAVAAIDRASKLPTWSYVVTPNAANMARISGNDVALKSLYSRANLCLLDSRVIWLAARLSGLRPPRVVPGADLVERLFLKAITSQTSICIVGGSGQAAEVLRSRYEVGKILHINPSMGFWRQPDEVERVAAFVVAARANYTFLVVGSPGQEMLAARIAALGSGCGVGICAGASIDFLTGAQRRAPRLLQRLALEWAYRLCREPRRLAYRYFVESPKGILMVLRSAAGLSGGA